MYTVTAQRPQGGIYTKGQLTANQVKLVLADLLNDGCTSINIKGV